MELTKVANTTLQDLVATQERINTLQDSLSITKQQFNLLAYDFQKYLTDDQVEQIRDNNFRAIATIGVTTYLLTFDQETLEVMSVEPICWIV
ncbi:MAG: hypothetical protein HC907_22105 [Richelia sp. SM1_7_0]|nr:hypothetical protein [Richelia sp. SM1_7_0]